MSAWAIAATVTGCLCLFFAVSVVFYSQVFKRVYDFLFSLIILGLFSPLFLFLCVIGAIAMRGNPFFLQTRPGKNCRFFKIIKFRTMNYKKDEKGNLLPDKERLNGYGKFLRKTSLDELPQLLCILAGKMSFIGPRPLLVKDMVFMTEKELLRHSVRGGLTGLAQASGRNLVGWETRFYYDLKYVERITFLGDVKILFLTVKEVITRKGINEKGQATSGDYGDYLLNSGKITQKEYEEKTEEARALLNE